MLTFNNGDLFAVTQIQLFHNLISEFAFSFGILFFDLFYI